MKIFKFINLSAILILLLTSCSNTDISNLPNPIKLKPSRTSPISDGCFYSIFIYDSLLILISDCDSNYFHIYNKNTLSLIRSFGKKGKSPSDFNSPFPFNTNTVAKPLSEYFDFYNLNSPTLSSINFKNSVKMLDLSECIQSTVIDKNLYFSIQLNRLQGNNISGIDISNPEGLFYIFNGKNKVKKWIEFSPKVNLGNASIPYLYTGSMCSDSVNILFANKFFDEISFYNTEGEVLKKYNFSKISTPVLSKQFSGVDTESMLYFGKSYGTAKHCYVTRILQKINEVRKSTLFPTQILVFDWNTNLINCFQLETLPDCFCVDEEKQILYCIEKTNVKEGFVNLNKYSIK